MELNDIKVGQTLKIDFRKVKNSLGVGSEETEIFAELYPNHKGIVYRISEDFNMIYLKSTIHYDNPLDWWYFFPRELEISESVFEEICKWEED